MSVSIALKPVDPDHLEPASPQSIFEDVLPFLQATCRLGGVIEIRALNATEQPCSSSTYLKTYGGCFDNLEAAAWSVAHMDFEHHPSGVYMTLSPVKPDLLARSNNQLMWAPKNLATDEEIARRHWLVLDFDPLRPKGVSSTDDELGHALALRDEVALFLKERG